MGQEVEEVDKNGKAFVHRRVTSLCYGLETLALPERWKQDRSRTSVAAEVVKRHKTGAREEIRMKKNL